MSGLFAWLTKLDWGSVPDWFGAFGTIAAVFVAVYLQSSSTKPKVKVVLSSLYSTPEIELYGFDVSIHNYGQVAVNVSELGIGVSGTTKRLLMSLDFNGGVIQPGQSISTSRSAVDIYDGLIRASNGSKQVNIYGRVTDTLGRVFSGKKQKFDLVQLKNEVEYQRKSYEQHKELVELDKEIKFHTTKVE